MVVAVLVVGDDGGGAQDMLEALDAQRLVQVVFILLILGPRGSAERRGGGGGGGVGLQRTDKNTQFIKLHQ